MARRKTHDAEFSLFPFLSVLVAVMGTLILVIAGTTEVGLAAPKQRVEVEAFDAKKKNPVYVECNRDGVLIHPADSTHGEAVFVPREDLDAGDSDFAALVARLAFDPTRYLQLLVRPEGVATFDAVRAAVSDTDLDVGYEPLFGPGDVRFHEKEQLR